jgi:hypothetical protein
MISFLKENRQYLADSITEFFPIDKSYLLEEYSKQAEMNVK